MDTKTPAAMGGYNGPVYGELPYQFPNAGLLPGAAQQAQEAVYPPSLFQQGYFTLEQLAHANWFTTRVHLSPTGKA